MSIYENYKKLRSEVPDNVEIVIAAKQRSADEIVQVINAGARHIGENYVQEAKSVYDELGDIAKEVKWHMIGDLQTNKINKALEIFDVIQTVDSFRKAEAINKRVKKFSKEKIPIYVEINAGSEETKTGILPNKKEIECLVKDISILDNIQLEGFMTIGSFSSDLNVAKMCFRKTKDIFNYVKDLNIPNVDMKVLSMGMSDSYKIAIDEGANMIRVGTLLFGRRRY